MSRGVGYERLSVQSPREAGKIGRSGFVARREARVTFRFRLSRSRNLAVSEQAISRRLYRFPPATLLAWLWLIGLHLFVLLIGTVWFAQSADWAFHGRLAHAGLLGFWLIVGPGRAAVRALVVGGALAAMIATFPAWLTRSLAILTLALVPGLVASALATRATVLVLSLVRGTSRREAQYTVWNLMIFTSGCAIVIATLQLTLLGMPQDIPRENLLVLVVNMVIRGSMLSMCCAPLLLASRRARVAAFGISLPIAVAAAFLETLVHHTFLRHPNPSELLIYLLQWDLTIALIVWLTVIPAQVVATPCQS